MNQANVELTAPPLTTPDPALRPRAPSGWMIAALAATAVAFGVFGNDYVFSAILVPYLVLSLAALGLNVLTGYAGQLSLGSAAFMAVGAFGAYNLHLRIEGLPLPFALLGGGALAAIAGVLFGLPSLRIRGFYLIVSTLAAQFFVQWALVKAGWLSNDNASGVISAPPLVVLGTSFDSPRGRYVLALTVVVVATALARNLARGDAGRRWMAVRDMDTAAAVIGIPILRTKLVAFAVSSFYCGVAGVLWAFVYLGTVEPHGFDLNRSFQILFIVILGGLGTIVGPFLGAAVIVLVPILLDRVACAVFAGAVDPGHLENLQKIVFGSLIVFVLQKQPEGLARLVRALDARLRRGQRHV